MIELPEITLWVAAFSAVIGIVFMLLASMGKAEEVLADISTGLHREMARALSSSNLAGDNAGAGADDKALNAASFKKFKVVKVTKVSHNTKLLRFEIPNGKVLGLSIGRHVSVRAEIRGKPVMRAYTPTSRPDVQGYFELLVKTYEMGKLSPHLHSLVTGDYLEVRGPVGRFKYTKNAYKRMGLIAGGTGLTPCLQVIRCILEGPEGAGDTTSFVLLFQNRSEADILLREELNDLVTLSAGRLEVIYYLSNPTTAQWGQQHLNERRGYINAEAVQRLLRPEVAQMVGICGPGGFVESMKGLLTDVGHKDEESVHCW